MSVPLTATPQVILDSAVQKHETLDRTLRCRPYRLLYADGSAVDKMPGSTEPFSLSKYRAFVGKTYKNVKLYISPAAECDLGKVAIINNFKDSVINVTVNFSFCSVGSMLDFQTSKCVGCRIFKFAPCAILTLFGEPLEHISAVCLSGFLSSFFLPLSVYPS